VTGRILNYFVALLACSILFNSFSLHFFLLVKMDPKYLEVVVSFTGRGHLLFRYSVRHYLHAYIASRIITFKLRLWFYSTTLCRMYFISFKLCYINPAVWWTRRTVWWPTGNPVGSVATGRDFACRRDIAYRLSEDCDRMATNICTHPHTHTHIYVCVCVCVCVCVWV